MADINEIEAALQQGRMIESGWQALVTVMGRKPVNMRDAFFCGACFVLDHLITIGELPDDQRDRLMPLIVREVVQFKEQMLQHHGIGITRQ